MKKLSHKRPDNVLHPVNARPSYWGLGSARPDEKGYFLTSIIFPGTNYNDAVKFCEEEAANRGISPEAREATIISSMFGSTFDQALAAILKNKEDKEKRDADASIGKAVAR